MSINRKQPSRVRGDRPRGGSRTSSQVRDREETRSRPAEGGLTWKKMDLHLHTPASSDYRDPGISYLDILKKAEEKGLDMIAFSDHNSVGGYSAMHKEIENLTLLDKLGRITPDEKATLAEYRRLLDKIVVLPAFEFTATFGFHILGIFPENTSVRKLEYLLLDLDVPEDRMVVGAPDVGSTSDVLRAYQAITAAGGLAIAAHANSSNGVAMQGFPFGGQTKIAYTQDPNLAALEVTDLESPGRRTTAYFFNGSKPEYPRPMHLIQGSDAHSLETEQSDSANKRLGVGVRVTEILVKEASFAALKELLTGNDFTRIRTARSVPAWDFLEKARAEGPNLTQSFHERATTGANRTRPVLHDIVAFANTAGGTVYVGAHPDDRVAIHGLERPEEELRLLRSDVERTIDPRINVEYEIQQTLGRGVIIIKVPQGNLTPYVYTPTGQIFLRTEGGETVTAGRNDILALVRKSGGVESPAPAPSRALLTPPAKSRALGVRPPRVEVAESPPHATRVPTIPQKGYSKDDQVSSSRSQVPSPELQSISPAMPSRSPAFSNLPPEKIKGQIRPMGGDSPAVTVPETPDSEPTQTTPAAVETETQSKAKRGGGRKRTTKAATEVEVVAEPPVPTVEEAKPEKAVRGRSRRKTAAEPEAAPVLVAKMEATVSSEHKSREELVKEAEAQKPRKGRSTRKKQMEIDAPTAAAAATEVGAQALLIEAQEEPGPQTPGELPQPAAKGRSRRKKGTSKDEAQSDAATAESLGGYVGTPMLNPLMPDPPGTGVEIISTEERNGNNFHTMRDLRNSSTVHNVTRQSARRLWHYAIMQQERGAPALSEVAWHPDMPIGIWRRDERAGDTRYDLVMHNPDGGMRIFYGVTDEGLQGPWRELITMAEEAGYWGPEPA